MICIMSRPDIINPSIPFRHRFPVQIRFTDIDMLGHLNNSIYLQFMDMGKVAYFTSVNGGPVDWSQAMVVVVNINCDFLAQTHIHEELDVLTRTEAIGEKSLTLSQQVVNRHTGQVKCSATTVMAGVDASLTSSAPIRPEWIAALTAYEGRNLQTKI